MNRFMGNLEDSPNRNMTLSFRGG